MAIRSVDGAARSVRAIAPRMSGGRGGQACLDPVDIRSIRLLASSYQIQEIINGKAGLFKNMGERRSLDRLMSRNCQFQCLIHDMFLKTKVATFRSDHDPSIPLKRSDDLIVRKTWHFAHKASSINSAPGEKV